MSFKGKVSLVTGGATGIGKATAVALSRRGAQVIILDIDRQGGELSAQEIRKAGFKAISMQLDIAKLADINHCISIVLGEFRRIDILINNAGIYSTISVPEMTEREWDRVLDVNLKGTFFLAQAVLPLMIRQKSGRIINVSSLSAKRGGVTSGVNYGVSKAGVLSVTKYLAKYAAPYGITVNAVVPGFCETKMFQMNSEEKRKEVIRSIPLGRVARPEEVAQAMVFLASDEAGYITGEILDVNGGIFMD